MDRTVGNLRPAAKGGYKSIEEIAPLYGATALVPYEAAVLHNVFIKSVAHESPRLFIPVLGAMATEE